VRGSWSLQGPQLWVSPPALDAAFGCPPGELDRAPGRDPIYVLVPGNQRGDYAGRAFSRLAAGSGVSGRACGPGGRCSPLAAVWVARGTSYVLLIPAALAAVSALPGALLRSGQFEEILTGLAVVLSLAASGILGFPIVLLLYDGLGNGRCPASLHSRRFFSRPCFHCASIF